MMFRNSAVWQNGHFGHFDSVFTSGELSLSAPRAFAPIFDFDSIEYLIFPGFCDVHVHLREPGFSYKETIESGTRAAARGGYTAVCAMPNLSPVPDSAEHLALELAKIEETAVIPVFPYGALTVGQRGQTPAALRETAPKVIAFSDDGRGVQSESMMRSLMEETKALGKLVVAHCEDDSLLHGGYIHDGEYAAKHGHRGISSESEWRMIERDLRLCKETGCAYHVCHISTKESVALIRKAKAEGIDVTCETAPHYLILTEKDLMEHGRFKMNPPLRGEKDREALIEGLADGTIDMIATDHAPHSKEEKSRGLEKSAFGIVGLETAFPLLYTELVRKKVISLERLAELMSVAPRKRFQIPSDSGFCVWDIREETVIDTAEFLSMGHSTPFEGRKVFGKNLLTVFDGKAVYSKI